MDGSARMAAHDGGRGRCRCRRRAGHRRARRSRPDCCDTRGWPPAAGAPRTSSRRRNDAPCLLAVIRGTPEGKKELVGLIEGVRESTLSWKELLLDQRRRGLSIGPQLVVAGILPCRLAYGRRRCSFLESRSSPVEGTG